MVICGDLEWYNSEFGFPVASSNSPCPYCKCDNCFEGGERPWTDFRDTAAWRKTLRKPLDKPPAEHGLYCVPGVSFWTLKLDLLHMGDLGVAAHTYGNVVW